MFPSNATSSNGPQLVHNGFINETFRFRSIELFKEFPCDLFLENPDAIDFKYYG